MNYEDFKTRIERAREEMHKSTAAKKGFWGGYITALKDIRDDTQFKPKSKKEKGGKKR